VQPHACLREVAGVVDGDDVVAEALATIDTTDSAWNVLRVICEEGRSDSARYAALRSDSRLDFGRSRLSQCLSTLVEADLVFTEGPQNDKYAIATPAGTAALDARFASDIGLQTGLGDFENEGVSETLQSKVDPCNDAQAREGGPRTRPTRNGTDGTADGDRPAAAEADATDQPAESGGRSHSSGFAPVETLSVGASCRRGVGAEGRCGCGRCAPRRCEQRRFRGVDGHPAGRQSVADLLLQRQPRRTCGRRRLARAAPVHGVRRKGVIEPARVRAGAYARPAGREGGRSRRPC